MKLTALTLAFIIILLPNGNSFSQQDKPKTPKAAEVKPQDYDDLAAKFRELDELPDDDVIVTVKEDNKSSKEGPPTSINIIVERKSSSNKSKKKALLNVDLSEATRMSDERFHGIMDELIAVSSARKKCGSIDSVSLTQIDVSRNYEVENDYKYEQGRYSITVPKGFVYDRASIPAIFWPLISPDSVGNVAPLLHDYLYRHGGVLPPNQVIPQNKRFSRAEADYILLEAMTKCGVRKWRREAVYKAVRAAAGYAWKGQ